MELLPCPFCGGKATFDHDDNGWNWVVCEKCGVSTNCRVSAMDDCKPILAEAWNRRASPASAPEGWKWRRHARTRWEAVGHWDSIEEMAYNDMLGRGWDVEKLYSHAAPTPPVSEGRKDAERLNYLQEHGATVHLVSTTNSNLLSFVIGGLHRSKRLNLREAIDAAMQEDKP